MELQLFCNDVLISYPSGGRSLEIQYALRNWQCYLILRTMLGEEFCHKRFFFFLNKWTVGCCIGKAHFENCSRQLFRKLLTSIGLKNYLRIMPEKRFWNISKNNIWNFILKMMFRKMHKENHFESILINDGGKNTPILILKRLTTHSSKATSANLM